MNKLNLFLKRLLFPLSILTRIRVNYKYGIENNSMPRVFPYDFPKLMLMNGRNFNPYTFPGISGEFSNHLIPQVKEYNSSNDPYGTLYTRNNGMLFPNKSLPHSEVSKRHSSIYQECDRRIKDYTFWNQSKEQIFIDSFIKERLKDLMKSNDSVLFTSLKHLVLEEKLVSANIKLNWLCCFVNKIFHFNESINTLIRRIIKKYLDNYSMKDLYALFRNLMIRYAKNKLIQIFGKTEILQKKQTSLFVKFILVLLFIIILMALLIIFIKEIKIFVKMFQN